MKGQDESESAYRKRQLPHLVLSGLMGTGKSTIGRILSSRTGAPLIDLDDQIVRVAAEEGRVSGSVGDLFAQLGEPAFRRLEADCLARALASSEPTIIAAGGGALIDPKSRELALLKARVVTLSAPLDVLVHRVTNKGAPRRPLLESDELTLAEILSGLLVRRAKEYAESHARVDTGGLSADDAASAVLRAWRAPSVLVRLGERSYSARFTAEEEAGAIACDVLGSLRPTSWLLVTDTTVDALWGQAFERAIASGSGGVGPPAATVRLTPGEREKNLAAVERVLREAAGAGLDRKSVIVAHGGGITSDVAGFAAAIFLRGVRWISVPTTLLSMADAAIGGKTGVDLGVAKNSVGAFHQPSAVIVDVRRTSTESLRAVTSGLAEVVKSGVILDKDLIEHLERHAEALRARVEKGPEGCDLAVIEDALVAAVTVKATVVSSDERETAGVGATGAYSRVLLNFGHTMGHALEAAGGLDRFLHGEAVSLGMVVALRVGVLLGITSDEVAERVLRLMERIGLPVRLDATDIEAALPFLTLDKKRTKDNVRAIFLADLGRAVARDVSIEDLKTLVRRIVAKDAAD